MYPSPLSRKRPSLGCSGRSILAHIASTLLQTTRWSAARKPHVDVMLEHWRAYTWHWSLVGTHPIVHRVNTPYPACHSVEGRCSSTVKGGPAARAAMKKHNPACQHPYRCGRIASEVYRILSYIDPIIHWILSYIEVRVPSPECIHIVLVFARLHRSRVKSRAELGALVAREPNL